MSENGSVKKSDVQDQADLLSEVIDELTPRPENKLEEALSSYFGVQGPAWRQYQNTLRVIRVVWDDDCGKAYQRMRLAITAAWVDFQDNADDAWDTYRTGVSFYDNKLRLIKHYTWQEYITDTAAVWCRYADTTRPAYLDYIKAEEKARHQLDCITTDTTLKYKRLVRAAWEKYKTFESPAWADLQQARKELRSAPDVSLERFEE